jgi:4-nitrophenyl phosphatase
MINAYLIDLEGTIVSGKSLAPLPHAANWLNSLKKKGKKFLLLTNNTTHPPEILFGLLKNSGFDLGIEDILTCVSAVLEYLQSKSISKCFIIGNSDLKRYFSQNGIKVCEDENVEAVVLGLDLNLNYDKLKIVTRAILKHNALLVALHENKLFQDKQGELSPSVGAIVKGLEYACDKKAIVLGKPNIEFYQRGLEKLKANPDEALMISDDPLQDLIGAKKTGIKTCWVKTGKYVDDSVLNQIPDELKPDFIYPDISKIEI